MAALPANAAETNQYVSISSTSCPSAGNCSAVGSYTDSVGGRDGLLLTETGGTWAVGVEAVMAAGVVPSGVVLKSVSCSSPGNCTAVGQYGAGSAPPGPEGLLLTETDGTWAPGVEAILPANARSSEPYADVTSVSCSSAGNCSAVGSYVDGSSSFEGLLLSETGGTWATGVEVSLPANNQNAGGAFLDSVSCASAGNCTAVGYYEAPSPIYDLPRGLLVSDTAGAWAAGIEAPLPANADPQAIQSELDSVSCASPGDCSAVGIYADNSGNSQGLLLTETGGSWLPGAEASLPANAATGGFGLEAFYGASGPPLSSISCASPGNCAAVGSYPDDSGNVQGLLLTETAGTWASGVEAALPADAATAPQGVNLTSVSCASAGNCSAVGDYGLTTGGGAPLLVTETAGSWATGVEPAVPGNASPATLALNSVSCASAGNCNAVGSYTAGSFWFRPGFGLLIGGAPTPVTLTVSTGKGTGTGTVSSAPAGIGCGTVCSETYPSGTAVTLTATPAAGSTFVGWSGCAAVDANACTTVIDSDSTIAATFNPAPVPPHTPRPCRVPNLKGKTLADARRTITASACSVGLVRRVRASSTQEGRVLSQSPRRGTRLGHEARVDLIVASAGPVYCHVPRAVGLSLRAAEKKLRAANCRVGGVERRVSTLLRENRVVEQRPARGRTRPSGKRVLLVVGKGPRTGKLPALGAIVPSQLPPFVAYDPPAGGIWLMNPDGSNPKQVGPPDANAPVWSPDATQILYTAAAPQNDALIRDDLYVMNADGTNRHPLMPSGGGEGHGGWGDSDFHWSPDGKHIVFTSGRYMGGDIDVANADGSDARAVPNTSWGGDASFSPDGNWILFNRSGGLPRPPAGTVGQGIYLIKPDGSGLRQLTFGGGVGPASWSPDGTRIIYGCLVDATGQAHAICELSGSPTTQRILYRSAQQTFLDPTWSADGTKILVTLNQPQGPDGIALMSASGGAPVMVTPLSFLGDSTWPAVSYGGISWNADW